MNYSVLRVRALEGVAKHRTPRCCWYQHIWMKTPGQHATKYSLRPVARSRGAAPTRFLHTKGAESRKEPAIRQQNPPTPSSPPTTQRRISRSKLWALILLSSIAGAVAFIPSSDAPSLNTTTFTPYTIVSRTEVTPTSFILTVKPAREPTNATKDLISQAWAHGLWSVEVKQPQLQIARNYTPLPPAARDGTLRFLIRPVTGGEVSSYLGRLRAGDTMELRGPHLGFDLPRRLGTVSAAVFLAGGTGIAPALQVARAVLEQADAPILTILWANRLREDCIGCDARRGLDGESSVCGGAVMEQLRELKLRHGGRLKVQCMVDEEGRFIREADVRAALGGDTIGGWSIFSSAARPRRQRQQDEEEKEAACVYHSSRVLERAGSDPAVEDAQSRGCICQSGGKKLLLVSGPDGFIQAFAGAKRWEGSAELQGPVGGVLGQMRQKYPELLKEWLVLKL